MTLLTRAEAAAMCRVSVPLKGLFVDDGGRKTTAAESLELMLEHLANGRRVLPLGECDNFDPVRGCLGHEDPT